MSVSVFIVASSRHIEIAFKIFDVNGDATVDMEEFEEILTVLRSQTSVGMRHRESKLMSAPSTGKGAVNSGLKQLFFGRDGKGKLRVQDFLAFQERMKDEVLWMEVKFLGFILEYVIFIPECISNNCLLNSSLGWMPLAEKFTKRISPRCC